MSFFLRCIVFFRYFFMYFFIIFVCNFLWIVFWLFFEIVLLCYFNLSSSITSCLSSEDLYLFLGISYSCSFVTVSRFFCYGFFSKPCNFIINLLPIKSPAASAVFWIALFEVVSDAYPVDCLAWSRNFWHVG